MSALVEVSMNFDGFEESMFKKPIYTDENHADLAFHRFALLRQNKHLTDAVIVSSDDKRFDVHRTIMAGTSDYFFNNLVNVGEHDTHAGHASDNACQLNIDSEAVEMIVTFCYSGSVELTAETVEDVLTGAKALKIASLAIRCGEMLQDILDVTNCIRLLEIADKFELGALKDAALEILADEIHQINKLPEFRQLSGSQMLWLVELLSNCQDGIFDELLQSLNSNENAFSSMKTGDSEAQSAIRAAYIAGFFQGSISTQPILLRRPAAEQSKLDLDTDADSDLDSNLDHSDDDTEEELPQVLGLLKRKSIHFSTFCEIEQKWETVSKKVDLPFAIESHRDAAMIPTENSVVIFHMQHGAVANVLRLALDSLAVESVAIPSDIARGDVALFCHLNDEIYCFPHTDQQFFHKFDPNTKEWSLEQLADVMDAKSIVGMNDELYFVGCGYDRKMVRSYHFGQNQWTTRGKLRYDNGPQLTCLKSIVLNDSIFVVSASFDSSKYFNGTEFLVQRYDENVEDWFVIKTVYHSRFTDHFHLDAIGGNLYLYYGDGEVQIYSENFEEEGGWKKGPTIEYNVLDVSLCMIAKQPDPKWKHRSP